MTGGGLEICIKQRQNVRIMSEQSSRRK